MLWFWKLSWDIYRRTVNYWISLIFDYKNWKFIQSVDSSRWINICNDGYHLQNLNGWFCFSIGPPTDCWESQVPLWTLIFFPHEAIQHSEALRYTLSSRDIGHSLWIPDLSTPPVVRAEQREHQDCSAFLTPLSVLKAWYYLNHAACCSILILC